MASGSKVDLPELPDNIDAAVLKIAGVVVLGAIMSILDITVVNVALPTFQTVFGTAGDPIAYSTVAWSVTAYTLALATVIPMTGWAADRFGTKRLYMTAIALFVDRLGAVRGRVEHRRADRLPGPAGPRRRHADAARHDDHDPGGRAAPDGPADGDPRRPDAARPDPRPDHRRLADPGRELALDLPDQRADRPGRARLRLAGAAQRHPGAVGVLRLPRHGADVARAWRCSCSASPPSPAKGRPPRPRVWVSMLIGAVLMVLFVFHSFRPEHPLLDLRLFKNRNLTVSIITMFLFAAAFFGGLLLVPTYFQEVRGESTLQAGLLVAPQGIGAMITMPIAGSQVDKRPIGRIVPFGLVVHPDRHVRADPAHRRPRRTR